MRHSLVTPPATAAIHVAAPTTVSSESPAQSDFAVNLASSEMASRQNHKQQKISYCERRQRELNARNGITVGTEQQQQQQQQHQMNAPSSAAGRVELVAVVHRVAPPPPPPTASSGRKSIDENESPVDAHERKCGQNSGENREDERNKKSSKRPIASKFSKLFSRKRRNSERSTSNLDAEAGGKTTTTSKLIDGVDSSPDRSQREKVPTATSATSCIKTIGDSRRATGDLIGRESVSSELANHWEAREEMNRPSEQRVVEFKFDLIVEAGEGEGNENQQPGNLASMAQQEGKLIDRVNDLIESFVLDSQDVCLLNVGNEHEQRSHCDSVPTSGCLRFDYLIKLTEHSLTYAFGLATTSSRCDGQSIELSAHLVASSYESGGVLAPIDLLGTDSLPLRSSDTSSIDCSTLPEALEVLERLKRQLVNQMDRHNRMLVVGLKLKRKINGGLFSNRMSLIDFDPKLCQMQTIFESIFNGQALAHLKRQKIHLQALESSLLSPSSSLDNGEDYEIQNHMKHHHQVASMQNLTQAEWLLYKQLSSALIRTLIIVNVFKLDYESDSISQESESKLMDYNLSLLEFARSIQKASCQRMRRRKKHLKSVHHLASSNASVASNFSSVSSSSSTNSRYHKELALWSSPVRSLRRARSPLYPSRYNSSRRGSNGGGGHNSSYHRHHSHHRAREQSLSPTARSQQQSRHRDYSTSRRKTSAASSIYDSMSLMRQATANRRQSNKLLSSTSHLYGDLAARHKRVANWRQQSDFTESSSMSTSSGGHSSRHRRLDEKSSSNNHTIGEDMQASRLNAYLNQVAALTTATATIGGTPTGDQFSSYDSDSIASANLNSHSSCSYNKIFQQQQQLRKRSSQANGEEHIELKWLAQSAAGAAPPLGIDQVTTSTGTSTRVMTPKGSQEQVIQIDCPPPNAVVANEGQVVVSVEDPLDNTDNVSDICSIVVAEPPKQLKLEEFLSQLTSVIGPPNRNSITSNGSVLLTVNRNHSSSNNNHNDDDDEDCKSHSSILEHLSCLAHESQSKFHNRQQLGSNQQHIVCSELSAVSDDADNNMVPRPPQRIPQAAIQLATTKTNPNGSVEERLKALTIDCHSTQTSSPISTPTSAFISSNESNCSSTESSSNSANISSSQNSYADKSSGDDSGHIQANNVGGTRRLAPSKIPNLNGFGAMDGTVLVRAVKHPGNYKPIIFCSVSLIGMGLLMVILGVVLLLIDHIELGPPVFDPQYERYEGTSLPTVMGPMFVAFGSLIILGNIFMLCYATTSYYQHLNQDHGGARLRLSVSPTIGNTARHGDHLLA